MIGKLKRSLKERCPKCGAVLQLRSIRLEGINRGVSFYYQEDLICCSSANCDYQEEITQKRKKFRGEDFDLLPKRR